MEECPGETTVKLRTIVRGRGGGKYTERTDVVKIMKRFYKE